MPDKIRILVLDDDGAHAEAASESLARSGYDCTVATSGTEGLQLLQKDGFDERDWRRVREAVLKVYGRRRNRAA